MKLKRLWVKDYKNLRDCEVSFPEPQLLNAVIGSNGSGKSNLVEALLHILIGVYFQAPPPFDFRLRFEAQGREVLLQGKSRELTVLVDDDLKPLSFFAQRLRDGTAQVYYPELTFVYYSGECQRVTRLVQRYMRHFERLTRKPETDQYRPLFVQSTNAQSQVILLALFAHGRMDLPERLGVRELVNISVVFRSPAGFDPERHEPKLWNTEGAVRRIVAAFDETASSEESRRQDRDDRRDDVESLRYSERRTYYFATGTQEDRGLPGLVKRLSKSGDNLYLALEHLRARKMFVSVSFQLIGRVDDTLFEFDQLSEGEKQLLAVVGALQLINRPDNLVLLDEPDTHLNPHWSWDYPSMLTEAFDAEQRRRSTVLMATHTPIVISGMTKGQVLLAHLPTDGPQAFTRPRRHPRGQGVANLLSSSEFFGLPSSLDKETQKLLDQRLAISVKEVLTEDDKAQLRRLNRELEVISPGVSERDPEYVAFLRQRRVSE